MKEGDSLDKQLQAAAGDRPLKRSSRRRSGARRLGVRERAFLDGVSQAAGKAMLVSDRAGEVIWQSTSCAQFGVAQTLGGILASIISASQVPGGGEVLLDSGREVRWTAQWLPGKPRLGAETATRAVLWVLEDLTSSRRCQRALEDAEARLRLLSTHTKGIIFELDAHARFVRVWASDLALLARPAEELSGHTIPEILGEELGRRHHQAVLDTLESGRSASYEYDLTVPEGRRRFACESVAVPAVDTEERHAVFWIRDITENVRIRNRLIETERLAFMGTLAAGVAHEINNPLGYLMLNAERLRATLKTLIANERIQETRNAERMEEQVRSMRASVELIHQGGRQVQHIVRDLLQMAKPARRAEPVDPCQAVAVSIDLTRPYWQTRARVVAAYDDVPYVLAHEGCLVQTMVNLVRNATEAMPTDTVQDNLIRVSVRRLEPSMVQIEVRDTGTGVSEEDAPHIFDPFFTTKAQGTGLGLAICQIIVNAFNGEIRFERAQDGGSIFRVLLPVVGEVPVTDRAPGPPLRGIHSRCAFEGDQHDRNGHDSQCWPRI